MSLSVDTPNFIFAIKQGDLGKTLEVVHVLQHKLCQTYKVDEKIMPVLHPCPILTLGFFQRVHEVTVW